MRKYLTELGLNMISGNRVLIQQDFFDKKQKLHFNPHIYFICRRPRISIDPSSITVNKNLIHMNFIKQVRDDKIVIPTIGINYLGTNNFEIISEYPNTEFIIHNKDTGEKFLQKAALVLMNFGPQFIKHLNLEVLYIGQSYGTHGSRNATDRLKEHSTLQSIYAEAIRKSPDQEIWLLLCDFEEMLLTSFDGKSKEYGTSKQEDFSHYMNVIQTEITEQQKINFTEAALIRYFQPEFNKIYKDSFPNPAHKSYSECYDLDLNMVNVEIQTDDLMLNLWSDAVKPKMVHFCYFPLHSKEDRKYMFDI